MSDLQWEIVVEITSDHNAPPGVRRLKVPGGYLYQVEHYELESTRTGHTVVRVWHPPVFVPGVR